MDRRQVKIFLALGLMALVPFTKAWKKGKGGGVSEGWGWGGGPPPMPPQGPEGLPGSTYPLWKLHKYNGFSLRPVPIQLDIGHGIPAPPPTMMPLEYGGQSQGQSQGQGWSPSYPPPGPSYGSSYPNPGQLANPGFMQTQVQESYLSADGKAVY